MADRFDDAVLKSATIEGAPSMDDVILHSIIACPHCGFAQREEMPIDACRFFYDCPQCGARLPQGWRLLRVLLDPLPAEANAQLSLRMRSARRRNVERTSPSDRRERHRHIQQGLMSASELTPTVGSRAVRCRYPFANPLLTCEYMKPA
jgi:hypothetical protein